MSHVITSASIVAIQVPDQKKEQKIDNNHKIEEFIAQVSSSNNQPIAKETAINCLKNRSCKHVKNGGAKRVNPVAHGVIHQPKTTKQNRQT